MKRWRTSRAEEGWKKRKRSVLLCAEAANRLACLVNQYDVGFLLACSHVVLVSYELYGSLSMLLRPNVRWRPLCVFGRETIVCLCVYRTEAGI